MEKLPKNLREKAISMFMHGRNNNDVLEDLGCQINMPEDELLFCIRRLKGEATKRMRYLAEMATISSSRITASSTGEKQAPRKNLVRSTCPQKKSFEPSKYNVLRELIINAGSNHNAAEPYYAVIARDFLEEQEGFLSVVEIPGPSSGRPFDLMGRKDSGYALIELKGSLDGFGLPGKPQRARMSDLIACLEKQGTKVNPYLLQICLDEGKYCLWDPDGVKGRAWY